MLCSAPLHCFSPRNAAGGKRHIVASHPYHASPCALLSPSPLEEWTYVHVMPSSAQEGLVKQCMAVGPDDTSHAGNMGSIRWEPWDEGPFDG